MIGVFAQTVEGFFYFFVDDDTILGGFSVGFYGLGVGVDQFGASNITISAERIFELFGTNVEFDVFDVDISFVDLSSSDFLGSFSWSIEENRVFVVFGQ